MRPFLVLSALILAAGLAAADLDRSALPEAVRATLDREAAGRTVSWVRLEDLDDKPAYVANLEEKGLDTRIWIAPDGTLLKRREHEGFNEGMKEIREGAREIKEGVKDAVEDLVDD